MGNLLRLLIAALFATTIVFFWGVISWMEFDWHDTTIHQFTDEAAVGAVLQENAPERGMYLLPRMDDQMKGDPTTNEAYEIKKSIGPFFFGAVRPGALSRDRNLERTQIIHLVFLLVSSIIMGLLLWIAQIETFLGRVGFVALMAFFAALVTHVPNWTWFEFSAGHTIASIGDTVIAWTLGGVALAALIWPSGD